MEESAWPDGKIAVTVELTHRLLTPVVLWFMLTSLYLENTRKLLSMTAFYSVLLFFEACSHSNSLAQKWVQDERWQKLIPNLML